MRWWFPLAALFASLLSAPTVVAAPAVRDFVFVYEVVLDLPEGAGPIDIFVPLAQSGPRQEVRSRRIDSDIPGEEKTETTYGNRFWHGHLERAPGRPVRIAVTYEVRRMAARSSDASQGDPDLPRPELRRFLGPNAKVPVSGPLVEAVLADLPRGDGSLLGDARRVYDYVIDNMEYKKVGTGWGNGDTLWACTKKYGNCTDFHALFISLARALGIPARFDIGFPIPADRTTGSIGGYHCWVEFHLPGVGWVPIDASEAHKNPAMREHYFGNQPPDRFRFTTGRDLELGPGHVTGPLNYFVYPHVEIGGKRAHEGVTTRLRFVETKAPR